MKYNTIKARVAASLTGMFTVFSIVAVYMLWELSQGAQYTAEGIPNILMNSVPYGMVLAGGFSYYVYKYVKLAERYLPRKSEEVLRRV